MAIATFDTVLINGSVGTGKTTTAEMLGEELKQCGIPGAVIDVVSVAEVRDESVADSVERRESFWVRVH